MMMILDDIVMQVNVKQTKAYEKIKKKHTEIIIHKNFYKMKQIYM